MFRPFSKLSARVQWSIILSALALLLLAAVGSFTWYVFREGLLTSADRSRTLARTAAGKLELILADNQIILEKVAALPSVRQFETQPCDPIFKTLTEFNAGQFERINLVAKDGRLICEPNPKTIGRESVTRSHPWFTRGIVAKGFTIGAPFASYPSGAMIVPLTHTVENADGEVIGLVVVSLDLKELRTRVFLTESQIPGLRAGVVSKDGQFVLHTERSLIGAKIDEPSLVVQPIGELTSRIFGLDKQWRLVGGSEVRGSDWQVFVGIPEDVALADARQTALTAAALGVLMLLSIAVPALWFGKFRLQREESSQKQVDELTELQAFLWANIPEGVAFFNDQGVILEANAQLAEMLNRSRDEIIGGKLNDFTHDGQASDRAKVRELGFNRWTTTFKRPNGSLIEIETKVQSFAAVDRKLYVGVFRDFTELRRAEAELRKSEELLEQTGQVAAVGGWELDLATMTARWTQETKRLHEVPPDYIPDVDSAIKFYPAQAQLTISAAVDKAIKDGTPYDLELPFLTARGNKLWIRTQGRAVIEDGKITRLIGTIQDFTAKRLAQKQLEEARASAEIASKAKSSFIAIMSHEIRTPLTGILGMADLLLTETLTTHQQSLVERLLRSGRVLLDLINDVLDFSKIEANKLTIERSPFVPAEIFHSVQELLEPIASEKGLGLRFDVDKSLAQSMLGDPKRLRQVLVNLIGNALKFTEKGSVSVSTECVSAGSTEYVLHVSVVDTGIGISPADQPNLFKPYVQAEQNTASRTNGTGLGLSICKLLVEAMSGHINVTSSEGEGSTFKFSIKLQADKSQIPLAQRGLQNATAAISRPLKVLAAEDNETSRYLIETMLQRKGHVVMSVENGALAVEAAQTHDDFDILLMDMQMPVMDGKDAVRAIRKLNPKYASMPIIALTADMVDENRNTYFDAGVDSIVGKPVDWAALDAEMNMLLHNRADKPQAPAAVAANGNEKTADVRQPPRVDYESLTAVADLLGAEKFANLLITFRANMLQYQIDLRTHVGNDDLHHARRTAHSLKGLALQFGAITVGKMAARMESDSKEVADISSQLDVLDDAIARTLEDLSRPGLIDELTGTTAG